MIVAEFIASQRTKHGVPHAIACRALEVSQSWFYKWINRKPTARDQRREQLDEQIRRLFTVSGETYGSPRITRDLREAGWKVSENTVAARMVELGLAGRPPKRRRSLTRPGKRPVARDLVRRNFTAVAPDVLWCGDVTQIDTDEGPLYLATTEDLFSRRMLGYAMSAHHDAAVVVASLRMAATTRGGDVDGVIFHTDRGSEYTAAATAAACRTLGVVQSMGRVGSALDNAAAEAFNSTLKVEFVHRHRFTTRAEARIKVATWIADFYNTTRRHSANDGLAPIPFEHQMAHARAVSATQVRTEVA
ncbi:IS3 family transposase [Kibdelosporangium philippinense]|uniref:IS3 family transposase n=1 Tax=Kibdelosporangium philippinense TaxID=211113 RepID=A0ABS8ZUJ2_9PSEU|nr:IS3 family transposase [Kibdelosporangium philippinense]MCE7001504.1 IS3 family transposase [Kibdelosporangium philippinense]MCE7002145.1 IS3 family transposase [Kibdelosporangium philippinense]MCE7004272.1 IS3 family transposase [Kibdelosporangium philippinense]MCE7004773.1 IS3 family transposase [Kibdelosporangium philippinense]MCE7006912.1 IS3 family transposase [Kibdelosporangium philippinense]